MKTNILSIFLLLLTSVTAEVKQVGREVPIAVEIMYKKGLMKLARSQKPDGSFPGQYGKYSSITGLSVLSFIASGEDPNYGIYKNQIKKAVNFILNKQDKNGFFGINMYNQNYTTLCLAEMAGAIHDERIGQALQQAVKQIVTVQSLNSSGGWSYQPTERKRALSTITGAALVGLLSARNAGVEVPQKAIDKGLAIMTKYQTANGLIGYSSASNDSRSGRTALGLLCFHLARQAKHSTARKAAIALRKKRYSAANGSHDWYGFYYTPQALFQENMPAFNKWNKQNIAALKRIQQPNGGWHLLGGKMESLSTNIALLSLAMNYRILPIYERQEHE
jgi:hypothetical protein